MIDDAGYGDEAIQELLDVAVYPCGLEVLAVLAAGPHPAGRLRGRIHARSKSIDGALRFLAGRKLIVADRSGSWDTHQPDAVLQLTNAGRHMVDAFASPSQWAAIVCSGREGRNGAE